MSTPNPLDTIGQKFTVELMNPNPTSSKTKAGPVYRVSFEVPREAWDCFMDANTDGMILEGEFAVTALNSVKPETKPQEGETKPPAGETSEAKPETLREPGEDSEPPADDKKKYPKANLAGMWCGESIFRAWLAKDCHTTIKGEAEAKALIKRLLKIESLRELDDNPEAGAEFDKVIRKPFMASRRK